jgi:hypothetical protein
VKSKKRLAILFGAVVVLMTLLAVVPVLGADATQRFPDSTDTTKVVAWAKQGTTIASTAPFIVIEVTDADLDVGSSKTYTATTGSSACAVGTTFTVSRTAAGTGGTAVSSTDSITAPILDNTGDGVVSFSDITPSIANINVFSVDALNGIVTLQCVNATVTPNTAFTLTYKAGAVETTATGTGAGSVKVTSDADATGINVILEETSAQSGIFRGYLKVVSANSATTRTCLSEGAGTTCDSDGATGNAALGSTTSSAATLTAGDIANGEWTVGSLKVNANDTVNLGYVDGTVTRSISIKIETTPPAYANLDPSDGTATTNNLPTVKGDVNDGDSSVDSTTVVITFGADNDGDGDLEAVSAVAVSSADITAITGGFSFEQRLPSSLTTADDFTLYWWVKTTDVAGNTGVSDLKPIISGVADACTASSFAPVVGTLVTTDATAAMGGCQPYSIRVDRSAPNMTAVVTGSFWDTTSTSTDKTNTTVTAGVATSIRVDFDASLDAGSVGRTDFTVGGATPLDAVVFTGRPGSVFLTVNALSPDARPAVVVSGSIKDLAGNELKSDLIPANATDGIAPTLTLTAGSGGRPVTAAAMEITLASNENASTATVVLRVGNVTTNTTEAVTATSVPPSGGPLAWTGTISPATAGLYNVYAEATDLNVTTNTGTVGQNGAAAAAIDLTKAVLFEVDKGIPTPAFIPASTTDDATPVISVNFSDEGKEYGLDSALAHTAVPANVVTDFDTHGTVTIVTATLDGVDISASLSTADNVRFLHASSALAIGNHVVVIKAKDEAGNEVSFTNTFAVTARSSASIPLVPGWNMISFSGNPADTAIDAVFGTVPVTVVMAYDPTNPAVWLIATRDSGTDSFSGMLTNISSAWGYWVLTDTFESISTLIPRVAGGAEGGDIPVTPPTISLVKGWNLVPVIDVTGNKTSADSSDIVPATYFGSVATITRVYWFDTLNNTWVIVTHGSTVATGTNDALRVKIGRAYWVFSTAAGTLTP